MNVDPDTGCTEEEMNALLAEEIKMQQWWDLQDQLAEMEFDD